MTSDGGASQGLARAKGAALLPERSNCPEFSLEFPITLPDQAQAIRLAADSDVLQAVKDFVERTSQHSTVTSARGEDARMDKMRWTLEARTADGRPQFPEFQQAIAARRLREPVKNPGVALPTGGRVTVRDVICVQILDVWRNYAQARREMKEGYARVGLGTNSVHCAATTEPGLDGMRHLPVIDPGIGETMPFHWADVNAIENITRAGLHPTRRSGPPSRRSRSGTSASGKRQVTGTGGNTADGRATGSICDATHATSKPRSHDTSRSAWAKLMARVGGECLLACPTCGGVIRLIAFIINPRPTRKSLIHAGDPPEPPQPSPARGPPTFWVELEPVYDDRAIFIRSRPTSCPWSTSTASGRNRPRGVESPRNG